MDVDIAICPACELSVVRLAGRVDGRTVLEALRRLAASEAWKPEFDQLWDYREVTELVVTQAQVDRVRAQIDNGAVRLGEGRTAILVRSITHEAYANLLIRISKDPRRTQRTFRRQRKAIAWLQQSNGALQPGQRDACACVPAFA